LSRGGRRKNDVIDAAAAASVAALAGEATEVLVENSTTVFALLDERRANLAAHRTRLVNQLHALLHELIPGGADIDLTELPAFSGGTDRTVDGSNPVPSTRYQQDPSRWPETGPHPGKTRTPVSPDDPSRAERPRISSAGRTYNAAT
jgi:hypothetical protein